MNNALPPYVFLPTGLFLAKLIAHKEGEDRSRWVTDFAVNLVEGEGCDDFASSLIEAAVMKQNEAMNRVRRSRAKSELISEGVKNPTRQQIEERLKEIYAEEEIKQYAKNGNAGVNTNDAGNGAASKSPTSCDTLTAAAATREGADALVRLERGIGAHTTVSRNMQQSAKTRDTIERCRYAPPSCSPEDGNIYDQEYYISTDDHQPEGLTGPSHGGSVASLEARQSQALESQRRAVANAQKCGRTSKSHSATARSAGPAKAAYGEFSNVMLTDDEFRKLCDRCPYANKLITELDQYIESQGKEKKYKNHYATLLNWSRRKTQEANPKQGYMTSDDISKKNYEESKARLEAMFSKGRKTA